MQLFMEVHTIEGGVSADDAGAHQADLTVIPSFSSFPPVRSSRSRS